MSCDEFRMGVQKAYGKEITDELWDEVAKMPTWGYVKSFEFAALLIQQHVETKSTIAEKDSTIAKMKSTIHEKDDKLVELETKLKRIKEQQRFLEQPKKQLIVSSVSEAAKNPIYLKSFRTRQVAQELCQGGFVCHKYFIEFTKAARLMTNGEDSRNQELKVLKSTMEKVKSELDKQYEDLLLQRVQNSLYPEEYLDEEAPQSALAADMLRFAVSKLLEIRRSQSNAGDVLESYPHISVSHQFGIVSSVNLETTDIIGMLKKIVNTSGTCNSSETLPSQSFKSNEPVASTGFGSITSFARSKINFRVDILCWFRHGGQASGGCCCCLASVEYKPDHKDSVQREAQADMYASNIQILHQKPCLSVDIAGGNDISTWIISVHALVQRQSENEPLWDKSLLYRSKGTTAIVRLASGLIAAAPFFQKNMQDFGNRLGPVVGVADDRVFKAYDEATTRNPNIDLVREFVDERAQLWRSEDQKLEIIEMCYHENNWNDGKSVASFASILEKLSQLHAKGLVHGDIRLANLLSSGYIVDFDFVGRDYYPEGLNQLKTDGRRHKEVDDAIVSNSVQNIKPAVQHDTYSMAQVMKLFQVQGEWWEQAIAEVESGNLDVAINNLRKRGNAVAHLNSLIYSHGIGPSPLKALF
ncbi:hypothetical protein IV203_030958 [Nitzschia inconspicua]|uniref:Protein kinase domain-containing protein n=1 Tax=Nitzschia inconspicua TaxID=303405 RepID=A0A9K3Q2P6_9STRA|nr:hypothetical protein IV203_030958 [Nitzschia inconspicua]